MELTEQQRFIERVNLRRELSRIMRTPILLVDEAKMKAKIWRIQDKLAEYGA